MSSNDKNAKSKSKNDGIYQEFLKFLKSPMWALPIMSFIEQRSLAFDRDQENDKLYKQIHNEFCNLVDMLIQAFCEDNKVKPSAITETIKNARSSMKSEAIHDTVMEPVIAAQDFNIFKHMMMRKNIELQLQALQMIEIVYGLIPAVLLPGGPEDMGRKGSNEQEQLILIEVINQSKEEYERERERRKQAHDCEMQRSIAEGNEKKRLQKQQQEEQELLKNMLRMNLDDSDNGKSATSSSNNRPRSSSGKRGSSLRERSPSAGRRNTTAGDTTEQTTTTDAKNLNRSSNAALLSSDIDTLDPAQLKLRQEYLRKQRDKLVNMKRESREKAFAAYQENEGHKRPKTAKLAKSAIRGGTIAGSSKPDADVLAARKNLAAKLRAELAEDF